jgi:hypothetical protein
MPTSTIIIRLNYEEAVMKKAIVHDEDQPHTTSTSFIHSPEAGLSYQQRAPELSKNH